MGQYARIQTRIWNSATFQGLSDDARLLWFYLLTCPHNNLLGMYVLKEGYALEDLGWPSKRFAKPLGELLAVPLTDGSNGLACYDESTKVMLIKNYLEHNPLENPNQVKAGIKIINELPNTTLFQQFKQIVEGFGKPLYEPLHKRLVERLGKPVTVTVTVTEAVTVTKKTLAESDNENRSPQETDSLETANEDVFISGPPRRRIGVSGYRIPNARAGRLVPGG